MRPSVVLSCLLAAFLVLLAGAAAPVRAQTGVLAGQVTDAGNGDPLASATVQALSGQREVAGALTDADGRFRLEVPAGTYAVVVTLIGYDTRRVNGVQVAAGGTRTLTIALIARAVALNPIVVTASRREEKRLDAPATVSIVDSEEIRQETAPTVIDHVKNEPGLDVAQTGLQQSNVVARGFNNIFSGALLVMTDNRYAQVPSLRVNAYNFIPTTDLDLDRVEIVLGPGAALYGPNAANGVMHLITTSPIDDPGVAVTVAGGGRSVFQGELRAARKVSDKLGLKVSGQYFRGNDWRYVDPAEVAARQAALPTNPNTKIGLRDYTAERWSVDGRVDVRPWDDGELIFAAGANTGVSSIELTGLGAAQAKDWRYTYVQTRLSKGRLFAQTFANFSNAGDTYLLRTGQPIVDQSFVWAAQAQHGFSVGETEDLTYGIDFQRTEPRTKGTITGRNENDDTINELGGYVHSETTLSDQLEFVGAARLDWHNRLENLVFSPRAALVFKPRENHTLRLTFNRAFSTPTTNNLFLDIVAGRVPIAGPIGYDVRTLGTPESGFTFSKDCPTGFDGGYCMRSPFVPGQQLPANAALAWNSLLEALAPPDLQPFLPYVEDPAPPVGTVLRRFDPQQQTYVPDPVGPVDIQRIKPTITNTVEGGYKGLIGDRVLLLGDVYHSNVKDFVTPLRVETPTVFLDPGSTAAFLQEKLTPLVQAGQLTPQQLAGIVQQLTTQLAMVPIGNIVPDQVDTPDIVLAYRNFGNVNLWGLDLGTEVLLSDVWSLKGSYSWVSEECFDFDGQPGCEGLLDLSLNAPQSKGTLGVRYQNDRRGIAAEAQARFIDGFPMNTGVYVGRVPGYGVVDANVEVQIPGIPGAAFSVTAYNVTDRKHHEFVGAPELGRLVLARLSYSVK